MIDHGDRVLSPRTDDRGRPARAAVPDQAEPDGPVCVGRRATSHTRPRLVMTSMHRSGPTGRQSSASPLAGPGTHRAKAPAQCGGRWTLPNGSVMVQTLSLDRFDDSQQARPQASRNANPGSATGRMDRLFVPLEHRANRRRAGSASGAPQMFEVPDPAEPGGRREQDWRFPSRTECLVCHSRAAGFVAGFTPLQLDRDHNYGAHHDNQLRTFEHIGLFEGTLPRRATTSPGWSTRTKRRARWRPASNPTCTSTARPAT